MGIFKTFARRVVLGLVVATVSNMAIAIDDFDDPTTPFNWIGSQTLGPRIYGGGWIKFGVTGGIPPYTCDFYGEQFVFDARTPEGKNMLSVLIAANLAGKKVDVWYLHGPDSGAYGLRDNQCDETKMAQVFRIGIRD